jgi:hypothetical protein
VLQRPPEGQHQQGRQTLDGQGLPTT